ncbi:MAG: TolC family protein [Proteobacteria bacterium]|nr:TolC family protein [Pseudomonadota bacterium]
MMIRSVLLLCLLLPASAWAGGPIKPVVPDEEARYSTGTAIRADESDEWWTSLQDPALNGLVVEALEANHDIGAAQARLHAAAGVTLQSVSPLLPTASFDVGLNASPSSNASFQVSPQLTELLEQLSDLAESIPGQDPAEEDDDDEDDPDVTWNGSALLNFGLNIDVGRSATALRAAQLDAAAAENDRDGVARAVVQQVVGAWLDVRTSRARVALIEGQIETNSSLLELTRARFIASDARGLDVLQQQQQLAATRALLPQAQQILRLREVQLATLLGRDPSDPRLPTDSGLPALPPAPGIGTPADLMTTRPDLAAASNRYLSARNRVASSALSFAPTFRLTGNVGYQLRWFKEWDSQETWGFGAGVSIPIFNGLQRHGQLKQAAASRDAAARSLSAAALTARAEVESALIREETDADRLDALTDQLQTARVAYEESSRQYASGLVNYLTVLTSLASWQAAELNQLQAQRDVLGARVDLHTALGAPWAARLNSAGGAR